jgi:proton-dependent oligopeptide transporter, POT family
MLETAFNIFCMGVNVGAMLAPLAAPFIHNRFKSYNLSFGAAALGMILSIIIFQAGEKHLVPVSSGASGDLPRSKGAA